MEYNFNKEDVFIQIENEWKAFMDSVHATKCVIGISGGIDSTCVAALACKIFGKDNVYGISMPCDGQKDISDVNKVFDNLKIKRLDFNIGDTFHNIIDGIENNALTVTKTTKTNLPARLRMAVLYAFAQSIPESLVINTCNLSESYQNYDTLFGDDCGSYAPIQELTKTEVRKLARYLEVPEFLVMKTPIDGLQDKSDEERFGFTYDVLDKYIRTGACEYDVCMEILKRYESGKFKLDMVNIKGPEFNFPDYIQRKNIENIDRKNSKNN